MIVVIITTIIVTKSNNTNWLTVKVALNVTKINIHENNIITVMILTQGESFSETWMYLFQVARALSWNHIIFKQTDCSASSPFLSIAKFCSVCQGMNYVEKVLS